MLQQLLKATGLYSEICSSQKWHTDKDYAFMSFVLKCPLPPNAAVVSVPLLVMTVIDDILPFQTESVTVKTVRNKLCFYYYCWQQLGGAGGVVHVKASLPATNIRLHDHYLSPWSFIACGPQCFLCNSYCSSNRFVNLKQIFESQHVRKNIGIMPFGILEYQPIQHREG